MYQFFIDFDGTIARNDVGNQFFQKYTGELWRIPIRKWLNGDIGSKECLTEECSYVKVTKDQFRSFAMGQELDPGFMDFYKVLKGNRWPVTILSDGMDFYIETILEKFGLEEMPFFSNHVKFIGDNRILPEFPYFDTGCGNCGNCKCSHIKRIKLQGVTSVYIGDGMSDKCGSLETDIIFAKKDLLKYLRENEVKCYEYSTFSDILPVLTTLETEKTLK